MDKLSDDETVEKDEETQDGAEAPADKDKSDEDIENQTGGKTEHRNEIQSMWLFKCERASGNAGGSSNIAKHPLHLFFSKIETAQLAKAIRCCANRKRSWKLTMLANILVRHNVGVQEGDATNHGEWARKLKEQWQVEK